MKVILLENLRKLGSIGEIIDVKRGFARNFLLSKKKALFASKENIKEVEKIKQELSKKDQDKKKEAKLIHEKIRKFLKISGSFRTRPNTSESIRMHPNVSEHVQTCPKASESLRKRQCLRSDRRLAPNFRFFAKKNRRFLRIITLHYLQLLS